MCIRRKKGYANNKRKVSKHTQTKKKKKQTCCARCRRKICRWCWRRIKRCVKKKVFGDPNPRFDDYEIAGLDLGSIRDKFKGIKSKTSLKVQPNMETIYKNNKKVSTANISLKDLDLIEGLEVEDLKKKFSITGSKQRVLENLVDDYKKGVLSSSGLTHKSKFNPKELDKEKLNRLIEDYDKKKIKSNKSREFNVDDIKKKFSLRGSKEKILDKMLEQYKKGNVSKSALSKIRRLKSKKLDKNEVDNLLKDFGATQKLRKNISITGLSMFKDYLKV